MTPVPACSECGRTDVKLTSTGKVWKHVHPELKGSSHMLPSGGICTGTGRPPKMVEPDDDTPACSVCGRTDVSLTKNGTLRHHAGDIWRGGRREYRCKGAGQPPKTTNMEIE